MNLNCQCFLSRKSLILKIIGLILAFILIGCQTQTRSHQLAINPNYEGLVCLYVGSWKGNLNFNILGQSVNHKVSLRSNYDDKNAFQFVVKGDQGSSLHLDYFATPRSFWHDSAQVYNVMIKPSLYYSSCEKIAPKTVLNFPKWHIYDLNDPKKQLFKQDPEIVAWITLIGLATLLIGGILLLVLGLRIFCYELIKLWNLYTAQNASTSMFSKPSLGKKNYCKIKGYLREIKSISVFNNLVQAIKLEVGQEIVTVILERIEIVSSLSSPMYLLYKKNPTPSQVEALMNKSIMVMGFLTYKTYGWTMNVERSFFYPTLISAYNLNQTSFKATKSMAIAIILIFLGVILIKIDKSLLTNILSFHR